MKTNLRRKPNSQTLRAVTFTAKGLGDESLLAKLVDIMERYDHARETKNTITLVATPARRPARKY